MSVDNENEKVDKGGRPKYERNDKDEGKLIAFLSIGFPHKQLALYMGRSINTLKKYYPDLFETILNTEDKTAMVENGLWYNAAIKLNVTAQIVWLKAYKSALYGDKVVPPDNEGLKADIFKELAQRLPN